MGIMSLKGLLDRFYEEMDEECSYDLGEIACNLVPKMDYKIERLEEENEILHQKLNDINDFVDGIIRE